MSCDKPTLYQHFRRTGLSALILKLRKNDNSGTIPPYKSSPEIYKKLFAFRQFSHGNLFQVETSTNEKRLSDQYEPSQARKKDGISGKIANRKKPRRRPTSHVAADEQITKQVIRSASVVYRAEEQCTSQRSLSMPANTSDVLVSEQELEELAAQYQKGFSATEPQIRKSQIPVLKNSVWKRPIHRTPNK